MKRAALIGAVAALAGCQGVGTPAALTEPVGPAMASGSATDAATEHGGYLGTEAIARLAAAVPPAPTPGSGIDQRDREASQGWKAHEDSDRWMLATSHAELRPPLALQHFDCALGVRLADSETPALARMMQKAFEDADAAAEIAKRIAHRSRPVGDDPDRRSCQRVGEAGRASPSYPSGSSTVGTVDAELLALIAPAQAEAVRETGRQIGVSRLVCAMHYDSDVAAGAALGRAVAAEIAATPAFQADLTAARAEIEAAQARGLTNPGCAAERRAFAATPPA